MSDVLYYCKPEAFYYVIYATFSLV